jgi:hypothetical protein
MDSAVDGHPPQLLCQKYNRDVDGQEPRCGDPDLYCKYRTACLIHFMQKNRERAPKEE